MSKVITLKSIANEGKSSWIKTMYPNAVKISMDNYFTNHYWLFLITNL